MGSAILAIVCTKILLGSRFSFGEPARFSARQLRCEMCSARQGIFSFFLFFAALCEMLV